MLGVKQIDEPISPEFMEVLCEEYIEVNGTPLETVVKEVK